MLSSHQIHIDLDLQNVPGITFPRLVLDRPGTFLILRENLKTVLYFSGLAERDS